MNDRPDHHPSFLGPLLARGGLAAIVLASALIMAAGIALANDPILHEFFIIPMSERGGPSASRTVDFNAGDEAGSQEAAAALSDALGDPDPTQGPPPLTIENRGDEMEISTEGDSITPDGSSAAEHNGPSGSSNPASFDRNTTLDEDLSYFTVFNPSVVPWKRGGARDAVSNTYNLYVRQRRLKPVQVQDRPVREGYERFWGSLLIHMEEGQQVPIPSPAPQIN
ncbi:MAG: hypothetical protein AAFX99_32120, partial [Myxococcota bacterium]